MLGGLTVGMGDELSWVQEGKEEKLGTTAAE